MRSLDGVINNKIGCWLGAGVAPPAGSTSVTALANLPAAELPDASNYLRLSVEADFGAGYRLMPPVLDWHGGPGQGQPALTWQFGTVPPLRVRPVLENGTQGAGSPAVVNSVDLNFS
jgi:hypothetical protein